MKELLYPYSIEDARPFFGKIYEYLVSICYSVPRPDILGTVYWEVGRF